MAIPGSSRIALLGAASLLAAAALAACGSAGGSSAGGSSAGGSSAGGGTTAPSQGPSGSSATDLSQQSIVIDNWAGYMPEDIAAQFKAKTGASATVSEHATNEEVMAKLTAGGAVGIDVAFVSGQYAQALNDAGLLEPITSEKVPNIKNLFPAATKLAYDPGNTFSVPYTWGNTGICYRSDLVDAAPTSWMDILRPNPQYDGKITMLSTERWLALPAQKALGFSVNAVDDGQLSQIKNLLIDAKKHLLGYDDTIFYEKLISGDAVMAEAWDGWCGYGIAENPDIKFTIPKEGTDLWVDTMVVLKGSKNKDAAFAFVNMMLDPEIHAWVTNNVYYNIPNEAAQKFVDPTLKEKFPALNVGADDLTKGEGLVDIGPDAVKYTKLTTDVTSS